MQVVPRCMTLEDFKIHILADGQKKYTEQQIQTMFEIASQFSNFAFKFIVCRLLRPYVETSC